ncbi:hypothetical protein KC19_4G159700 [Ceratodon purpureus]|uniref:Uncharacterized protein n=1 Tax=Ceratodon purpureus TaxID=3225 RepID=A0A8T0IBD0_CERPU|nr:hypothetical protein KC19_4G159700 [Ceratodon purpureus]
MGHNLGVMYLIRSWNPLEAFGSLDSMLTLETCCTFLSGCGRFRDSNCVDNLEEFCISGFQKWRQFFLLYRMCEGGSANATDCIVKVATLKKILKTVFRIP